MPNDRVDAALAVIAAIAGDDDRTRTENDLRKFNLAQVDTSLSIGGFRGPFKSEPETFRRTLVRAVLLVKIAKGTVQVAQAAQNMTSLMTRTTAQLQHELLSLFPYKPYRGNFEKRRDWAPAHFTKPSEHAMTKYMYLTHTLQRDPSKVAEYSMGNAAELENFNKLQAKYAGFAQVKANPVKTNLLVDFLAQYLADPDIIRGNIISSSLISETKHATYYPIGYIMEVPPECIYITSPSDVGVNNRTTDVMAALMTAGGRTQHSILTPQEVLTKTNGVGGDLGYNEIVVVGTAPEGKQVKVTGIFVKTDMRNNLYVYSGTATNKQTAPYVDARTQQLISDCAKKFKLPIVAIPDATSGLSNTPWPFGRSEEMMLVDDLRNVQRARTHTI